MSSDVVRQRLRIFLLLLAAGLSEGAIVELWAAGCTEELLQWVPFVLCVLLEGLTGGNRFLAPGMLAVGALIALAATYGHPALVAQPAHVPGVEIKESL